MKTITIFYYLMKLAYAMGKAEKREHLKAKELNDVYRDLCLKADEMIVGYNFDIN